MSGAISTLVGAVSAVVNLAARVDFQQNYEICPIYLVGGIAGQMAGGIMPITALTQPLPPSSWALANIATNDAYFAKFYPLPGATLIDDEFGEYPFANQAVAANAVIAGPLVCSMVMVCPTKDPGGYGQKLSTMTALQSALAQHRNMGGLYNVATPSFVWTNCLLKRLVDISSGETKQKQTEWQFDFRRPLVTLAQAQMAMNNQMSKIASGVQTDGSSSGGSNVPGNQVAAQQLGTGGNSGIPQ